MPWSSNEIVYTGWPTASRVSAWLNKRLEDPILFRVIYTKITREITRKRWESHEKHAKKGSAYFRRVWARQLADGSVPTGPELALAKGVENPKLKPPLMSKLLRRTGLVCLLASSM